MNSFKDIINRFESELTAFLANYKDNALYEHMLYALHGGGKRIRPLLTFLSAEAFGGSFESVLPAAISIELIHTYSLIHDDLPSMDNDDIRRNKPSMHKKYGEGIAVLVGDALLNLAYETLLTSVPLKKRSGYLKGIAELSKYSGLQGMVGGQLMDICNRATDKKSYIEMYSKKTSALLQAACTAAAYISGACKREVSAIAKYAYNLGIAFQIKDDLLELSEEKNNEQNIVSHLGRKKAEFLCEAYTQNSIKSLSLINNNYNLIKIANMLLNREY